MQKCDLARGHLVRHQPSRLREAGSDMCLLTS